MKTKWFSRAKALKAKGDKNPLEWCQMAPCHLNVKAMFYSFLLPLLEINVLLEMSPWENIMTGDINDIEIPKYNLLLITRKYVSLVQNSKDEKQQVHF